MELIIESIVDALRDKIAGGVEAVRNKTAGKVVELIIKSIVELPEELELYLKLSPN